MIVGDNETRLSVRLFSDVAQGRGHVAPLDIVSVMCKHATLHVHTHARTHSNPL